EGNDAIEATLGGALAAHVEHVGVDIANSDAGARAAGASDPESDVTSAAGEIEQRKRPLVFRRGYRPHQRVLPGAMQSARHQVVHQVIASGDRMKDVIDAPLLVLERHAFVAEMGLFAASGHTD